MLVARKKGEVYVPYLRAWRANKGLTQAELARQAAVVRSTVYRAETGLGIGALTAARLARALGISVAELRDVNPEEVRP